MEDLVEHVVALPGRELALLAPRDGDALLSQEAFERDEFLPYWAELWPSALALARVIARRPLTGRRVIELGCGLGLPALAAALAGGRVLATDWSEDAVAMTARNAERNGVELDSAVFRWDAPPEPLGPPWPLVLASDVLYEDRNVAALLDLLPRLTAAAGRGLARRPRPRVRRALPEAAAATWRIDAIPHDGPAQVTVHRLKAACRTVPLAERPRSALEERLEPGERAGRLALGGAGDEEPAGHPAEEPARLRVLVEVVEAGLLAAVERGERVDDPRVRAGRPAALPDGMVRRRRARRATTAP